MTQLWSEILIAIENAIETNCQPQNVSQEALFLTFNKLLHFASCVTDSRLVMHVNIVIAVYKLFVAVVTANYALLGQVRKLAQL